MSGENNILLLVVSPSESGLGFVVGGSFLNKKIGFVGQEVCQQRKFVYLFIFTSVSCYSRYKSFEGAKPVIENIYGF